MKKVVCILFLVFGATFSFAQNNNLSSKDTQPVELIEKKVIKKVDQQASKTLKLKIKVKEISDKKNNDIISIKAYRKSLNVKVKTVKLC